MRPRGRSQNVQVGGFFRQVDFSRKVLAAVEYIDRSRFLSALGAGVRSADDQVPQFIAIEPPNRDGAIGLS